MLRTKKIVTGLRNLLRKKHASFSDKNNLWYSLLQEGPGERGKKKNIRHLDV